MSLGLGLGTSLSTSTSTSLNLRKSTILNADDAAGSTTGTAATRRLT